MASSSKAPVSSEAPSSPEAPPSPEALPAKKMCVMDSHEPRALFVSRGVFSGTRVLDSNEPLGSTETVSVPRSCVGAGAFVPQPRPDRTSPFCLSASVGKVESALNAMAEPQPGPSSAPDLPVRHVPSVREIINLVQPAQFKPIQPSPSGIVKMGKDYGAWSVADLKTELHKRNAKVTGKKAVLVQRLQDYDSLFGNIVNAPEAAYVIQTPEYKRFRDVNSHSEMPRIKNEDLKTFSRAVEREDVKTSKKMYDENFLLSCRVAKEDNDYFIIGTCASEMRKQVIYNLTLKCNDHTIIESQCECAAGMGPYAQCKHIMTLVYGLIDFTHTKTIKTRRTCTELLQSFHRPTKFYSGEPVEVENLTLKSNDSTLRNITNFDPRPAQCIISDEKYTSQIKNQIINFTASYKINMPMAQIIEPGNKEALYKDHDYLEKTHEELYLDSLLLSEGDLKKLQNETKENYRMWKEQRQLRIHSSNFGKICKSKETTKTPLAKSLLKDTEVMTSAIKHGLKYEGQAVKAFTEKTGLKTKKCGIIVSEQLQYLASTPDRLIGNDAVLEVKCPFSATKKNISPENIPYLYLCEQTGKLALSKTHDYYYQVQGQLFCTNRTKAYFCVYTITDICIIEIIKDEQFIDAMINKLTEFYNNFYKDLFLKKYFYNIKI